MTEQRTEQERRINEGMKNSPDPVEREAYALVDSMGWSWYHLESGARQVARAAAKKIVELQKAASWASYD